MNMTQGILVKIMIWYILLVIFYHFFEATRGIIWLSGIISLDLDDEGLYLSVKSNRILTGQDKDQ